MHLHFYILYIALMGGGGGGGGANQTQPGGRNQHTIRRGGPDLQPGSCLIVS